MLCSTREDVVFDTLGRYTGLLLKHLSCTHFIRSMSASVTDDTDDASSVGSGAAHEERQMEESEDDECSGGGEGSNFSADKGSDQDTESDGDANKKRKRKDSHKAPNKPAKSKKRKQSEDEHDDDSDGEEEDDGGPRHPMDMFDSPGEADDMHGLDIPWQFWSAISPPSQGREPKKFMYGERGDQEEVLVPEDEICFAPMFMTKDGA